MKNGRKTLSFILILILALPFHVQSQEEGKEPKFLNWSELPSLPPFPGDSVQLGVGGPFSGISNDALIVAGGANFPHPVWENEKVYHNRIYVLQRNENRKNKPDYKWVQGFYLHHPVAYGASVSTSDGVVCMGGMDGKTVFSDVFLLVWQPAEKRIKTEFLPNLPVPCTFSYAAKIGNIIYIAGGQSGPGLETAMKNFWSLDLSLRPHYENMPAEELQRLCHKRGIRLSLAKEEISAATKNQAGEIRQEMIGKLFLSDSLASRFDRMSTEKLRRTASKYGINQFESLRREDLPAALYSAHWGEFVWQKLPSWPGPTRALNITAAQHNGKNDCIYVISGRRYKTDRNGQYQYELLKDVYEFDPAKYNPAGFDAESDRYAGTGRYQSPWRRRADAPVCMMAGAGTGIGQSHIFILSGADGSLISLSDEEKKLRSFPRRSYAYHTITDTWIYAGAVPINQVTTVAVKWHDDYIVPCGEIRARVRSDKIWKVTPVRSSNNFGRLNFTMLGVYLLGMVGIGFYFMKRNKTTDDYFRGGQHIPWWAAGCSIFATMLSSITYMSVPAIAFAANWEYILGYPAIIITAGIVVYFVLPFFRQIDATSAYEYLEKRFNRATRLIGSFLFILFQIGRMAIVMFLSALALAAITPFTEVECILIMGLLSIIYCTLGGVEAVIWTDTVQTFVLMGGALLIFALVLFRIDGGFSSFLHIGMKMHKFHAINWDWDLLSYTTAAFWVLILGGMGQNLVSYTSDQAVVQRYMTTADEKKAAKSIWTNGLLALPSGLIFFGLGTALFVFYKSHPAHLDPTFKTDAIMPLFIAREVPAGIAGLMVAGIFAAAQSTVSTSMNSTATAFVTDFFRPFRLFTAEKSYLNIARLMTVLFGIAGTGMALVFSRADIKSLLEQFFAIIGLFGGSLGGLFLLGMFTRRASGPGAVVGAVVGAITLYWVSTYTNTHFYLYATIGVVTTMAVGYTVSLMLPATKKNLTGLTFYTRNRGEIR